MLNLQIKAYTNNDENTGLQQQQCIHLRDAKLAIRLLEEDQEWELQTLMYILLSLLIYKNHCHIPSFQFSLHIRSVISSSSSVALQPGVGLGLLYNRPPSLSIPCSVSPFVSPSSSLAAAWSECSMCQMSSPYFQSFVSIGNSLCSEAYCKVS